jgi:putative photosynthetic complex assembly protein
MPAGTNGFVRAAIRGLARQRHKRDIGAEPPFVLTRWDDGRHSLEDTATGERIYLEAFGSTQVQTFAELLSAETIQ